MSSNSISASAAASANQALIAFVTRLNEIIQQVLQAQSQEEKMELSQNIAYKVGHRMRPFISMGGGTPLNWNWVEKNADMCMKHPLYDEILGHAPPVTTAAAALSPVPASASAPTPLPAPALAPLSICIPCNAASAVTGPKGTTPKASELVEIQDDEEDELDDDDVQGKQKASKNKDKGKGPTTSSTAVTTITPKTATAPYVSTVATRFKTTQIRATRQKKISGQSQGTGKSFVSSCFSVTNNVFTPDTSWMGGQTGGDMLVGAPPVQPPIVPVASMPSTGTPHIFITWPSNVPDDGQSISAPLLHTHNISPQAFQ
ncbi:uncharacterized protein HD556DRAFT_1306915 [Suillus plorans]|uniref:Uncharacterized protein n=1 Tax=Suillus plorans TaxID=116603 RepID=A0A9P7AUY0_9AGAM|nr:uncharacterized protein HD556DRAFT_1306915 [Suillus plorans]KAG1796735.1 hypothetical protein HD556DRAFT_1306915 [Suillus plorans]